MKLSWKEHEMYQQLFEIMNEENVAETFWQKMWTGYWR